jgi:hypothetical protein
MTSSTKSFLQEKEGQQDLQEIYLEQKLLT